MYFDSKWSEIKAAGNDKAVKDKFGSKQAWQDAKARSQGYKDEKDRRGNSGERHEANNPKPDLPDFSDIGGPRQGPEEYYVPSPEERVSQPAPTPEPTPAPTPEPTPTPTSPPPTDRYGNDTSTSTAAQNSQANAQTFTKDDHLARMAEGKYPIISSQMPGYATDRIYRGPDWQGEGSKLYTAKEADDAGWTPGKYQNDYIWSGPTRQETNYARQRYNEEKSEVMGMSGDWFRSYDPKKVSEFASWEYDPASDMKEGQIDWHETARALAQTGQAFSPADVARNRSGGSKRGMMPHIYDKVGGYDNWFENYSLYGANGFQSAPDLMQPDQIYNYNVDRQQRYKDWRSTPEWEQKYGIYGF